jgi:hypothetical protein
MRREFAIFRSHHQKMDLVALSEGYVISPNEELDAIDEEVLEPTKILAGKFEEEVIPPPLNM